MELSQVETANLYAKKLKKTELEIKNLVKLSKLGGCKLSLDFNKVKKSKSGSCGVIYIDMSGDVKSKSHDHEDGLYDTKLKFKQKLIDSESFVVINALLEIKKAQRSWLKHELNKLGIKL